MVLASPKNPSGLDRRIAVRSFFIYLYIKYEQRFRKSKEIIFRPAFLVVLIYWKDSDIL